MEGQDQYDLTHFIAGTSLFQPIPHPPPSTRRFNFSLNSNDILTFRSSTCLSAPGGSNSSAAARFIGFETAPNGRWPRQETLTLLEIRSRLDSKFKEANQKGPLWDEVSRIMYEEHGYQRSGKKCREKFENLYKYYKKTKEGKAGRQDGKHYRFFRQLEALYAEPNNSALAASAANPVGSSFSYSFPNNNIVSAASLAFGKEAIQDSKLVSDSSLSLSNYSDADASSSDDTDVNKWREEDSNPKSKGKRGWKAKIRDFIDVEMRKLMDKQEAWMEGMMQTIEHKERERMLREDEWRRQDVSRIEREHELWASERAWIKARDAALMEALHKLSSRGGQIADQTMTNSVIDDVWPECELTRLIELRAKTESKFQQRRASEEALWEDISGKMACLGHHRSGAVCKEKWDSVNNYLLKCSNKKRRDSEECNAINHPVSNQGFDHHTMRLNSQRNSDPTNYAYTGSAVTDGCFRYLMGDAYGRIVD